MRMALILLSFSLLAGNLSAEEFEDGIDYRTLAVAVAPEADVIQFFSYACIHCYNSEDEVDLLLGRLKPGVTFKRLPVSFGIRRFEMAAYAYYVAERLDMVARVHDELFEVVHEPSYRETAARDPARRDRLQLLPDDVLSGVEGLEGFFLYMGVDSETFRRTLAEVMEEGLTSAGDELAKSVRLTNTPSFLIKGKYTIVGIAERHQGEAFTELVEHLLQ